MGFHWNSKNIIEYQRLADESSSQHEVGIEEDPVKVAVKTHRLIILGIAFLTATHRITCIWYNVR